ncbi:metallophosphoesterase [Novosphingobium colocasiae]|uniref:3',5'-cyclic adenosine monophosphate phosphodiesterase CpdA n=1 Tax=Novosphingobium colocasiae TaxID=1256513 RepID=A0A918PLR5_9SPHN|nr:metallophosphoesterase [Novosphingobium colocasiae]GGZ14026.1 3',5'-cyclic adenosine monophosphate phosphodiesterase CpdA [Novosphingobium colocasiae]
MLIAQATDLHIGFEPGNPDEPNTRRFRALLDQLCAAPDRPDALVLSGDLTEFGDAESYARLAAMIADLPFPVLPMVGNHDLRAPFLAAFPACPTEGGFIQYNARIGPLRLLVLDTLEEGRHGGAFCEARAGWLADRLAEDAATPTVLALHHPPFESGLHWLDSGNHEPWVARLAAVVAGAPNVVGLMSGHLHRSIAAQWQGMTATVCSSSAAPAALDLRAADPETPDGRAMITDAPPVYALHRWDGARLATHFEWVAPVRPLAFYDESFQPVVRVIAEERGG